MRNAIHPQLRPCADDRTGEDRDSGRDEDLVLDMSTVEVSVWTDEDRVADNQRMVRFPSQHRILHDDDVPAQNDRTAIGVQHGAVEDTRSTTDARVTHEDRSWRDPSRAVDASQQRTIQVSTAGESADLRRKRTRLPERSTSRQAVTPSARRARRGKERRAHL